MGIPNKQPGIYIIRDTESGKFYIGSAKNADRRISQHERDLNAGTHVNKKLQATFNQTKSLVVEFHPTEDRDAAFELEQKFLDANACNPLLLNLNLRTGYRDEVLNQQVAEAMRQRPVTEKQLQALHDHHPHAQHWVGRQHTEETKERMRESSRTSPASQERLKNMLEQQSIPVTAKGVTYPSVSAAARAFGMRPSVMDNRCRSENPLFKDFNYVEK